MADQTVYHVVPRDDQWAVEKEGASRASSVAETKTEAVAQAKEFAENQRPSKVVVHKADGTVQQHFTYDADGTTSSTDPLDKLKEINADQVLEEIKVQGEHLVDRVRAIFEEGNARRIIIKKDGRAVLELPMSVGVGGAAAALWFSPVLAALGAFAALVSDVSIVVERIPEPPAKKLPPKS
jgi:hypothetical protein